MLTDKKTKIFNEKNFLSRSKNKEAKNHYKKKFKFFLNSFMTEAPNI